MAVDGAGNVFVADTWNHTIRKITPTGVVTTLAGTAGSSGSADGTGATARFNEPFGVAVDGAGNVFVADTWNHTIRKITPTGVVTTLAGTAGFVEGSADGTGAAARFNEPYGVAVDGAGNVFVADTDNNTIRKITPSGVVTTLAGTAGSSGSTDGTGAAARFYWPEGVAVDGAGNVFVADAVNYTIRKITPSWRGDHACRDSRFVRKRGRHGGRRSLQPPLWRGGGRGGQRLCRRQRQQHHPEDHACWRGDHACRDSGFVMEARTARGPPHASTMP